MSEGELETLHKIIEVNLKKKYVTFIKTILNMFNNDIVKVYYMLNAGDVDGVFPKMLRKRLTMYIKEAVILNAFELYIITYRQKPTPLDLLSKDKRVSRLDVDNVYVSYVTNKYKDTEVIRLWR
jgi:hypothetical protein